MLRIENLSVHYGGIHALQGASFEVPEGKIVTLIGANGAGKSTSLKAIVGLVKPSSGSITLNGESLVNLATKDIVRRGVVLAPEGRRIFPNLTTEENLELGAFARSDKAGVQADKHKMFQLFPRLEERRKQKAGTMSGGEQQMLAVARALMSRPKLLMMDEPSLGLAPLIVKMIFDIVRTIAQAYADSGAPVVGRRLWDFHGQGMHSLMRPFGLPGSQDPLANGMMLNIHPGLMTADGLGISATSNYLVTASGGRPLGGFRHRWQVL